MKTTLAVTLALLLPLSLRAQSNSIKGTPVVDVDLGYSTSQGLINPFATAVNPSLSGVTGTNVNIDFSQPVTVWSTTNAPAVRFAFINKPTTATNGPATSIQIIGQVNTVLTNVADTINWIGPWGTLNANTNYVDVWWDGTILNAAQSPSHGVIAPAQITSNQNDYNPTGLNTADELRVSTDAPRTLTGLQGRISGKVMMIENIGGFPLTLSETNVASATTNQFRNGYDVVLGTHQSALMIYSMTSQRWKVAGSVQGHPAIQSLTDGATVTITVDPVKVSENQVVTLGGNRTLAISGATSGTTGVLWVNQDNVGSRSLTLPANSKVINGGGGVIVLTTTPLATDILTWIYNGTNYFWNKGLFYN